MVLAATQQRRHGTEQADAGGEGEGLGQPLGEGRGDEVGEELPAGQVACRRLGQMRQLRVTEEDLHRVVAQERGEEASDRWQVRDPAWPPPS